MNVKGISLLETTLAEHAHVSLGEGSTLLVSRVLFNDLFAKVGDQNTRLREAVEDILLQMAGYTKLVGPSQVLQYAPKIPIESETKPPKMAIGKLQLVHKIIEKHSMQLKDQQLLVQAVLFSRGGF